MRKSKINEIPKNTQYCYSCSGMDKYGHLISYKECPYFKYRKTNFGFGGKKTMPNIVNTLKNIYQSKTRLKIVVYLNQTGFTKSNYFFHYT